MNNKIPLGYSLTPRRGATVRSMPGACRHVCVGGGTCVCYGNINHEMHLCKDSSCVCHSRKYLDSRRIKSSD
jgi:hypothetical protein